MSGASRRLQGELSKLMKNEAANAEKWHCGPLDDSDLFAWTGTIVGPADTGYEGGQFQLSINFPSDYPFKPPNVQFQTQIFHPNVDTSGGVCLEMLKNSWSPARTIAQVMDAIHGLMSEPNCENPLNPEAASLYVEDKDKFNEEAAAQTTKYATAE